MARTSYLRPGVGFGKGKGRVRQSLPASERSIRPCRSRKAWMDLDGMEMNVLIAIDSSQTESFSQQDSGA